MLQRTIFPLFPLFAVCGIAFPFVYIFFSFLFCARKGGKKGRKWIGKKWQPGKIQLQLRIRMVKSGLCVDVASLATSIMAFYSTGKIDSVIEQFFSSLSLSLSLRIFHTFRMGKLFFCLRKKLRACECMRELENLILNDCCKILIDPEFFAPAWLHKMLFLLRSFFTITPESCVPFPN